MTGDSGEHHDTLDITVFIGVLENDMSEAKATLARYFVVSKWPDAAQYPGQTVEVPGCDPLDLSSNAHPGKSQHAEKLDVFAIKIAVISQYFRALPVIHKGFSTSRAGRDVLAGLQAGLAILVDGTRYLAFFRAQSLDKLLLGFGVGSGDIKAAYRAIPHRDLCIYRQIDQETAHAARLHFLGHFRHLLLVVIRLHRTGDERHERQHERCQPTHPSPSPAAEPLHWIS